MELRKVVLSVKMDFCYRTIKSVCDGNISRQRAEVLLGVSYRTVSRYIKGYKERGKAFFLHGNANRVSPNAISEVVKNEILELYMNPISPIYMANFAIVTEYVRDVLGFSISESSVRNIFKDADILAPRAWRSSRKRLKKQLANSNVSNCLLVDEDSSDIDKILDLDPHPIMPKKKYAGELIQMDASSFEWFLDGGIAHCHVAVDNATGSIVGLYLDEQETLNGYFNVLKQILCDYGIPYEIRTDKRTVFDYQRLYDKSDSPNSFIQFKYVCNDLGVLLSPTSSPQHKGQVERLNGSLQDRLTYFLKLHNVSSIEEANALIDDFKKYYNDKFASPFKDSISCFDNQVSDEKIYLSLSVKARRVVSNGNYISLDKKKYIPVNSAGEFIFLKPKTKVLTIKTLDDSLFVSVEYDKDMNVFALKEIPEYLEYSREFDFKESKFFEKKSVRIPASSYHWRGSVFERFLEDSEEYFGNSIPFSEMMYSQNNYYISNIAMPYEYHLRE